MPDIITSWEGFHGIKALKAIGVSSRALQPGSQQGGHMAVPKQQVTRGLGTTL